MGIMVPDNVDISSLGYISEIGKIKFRPVGRKMPRGFKKRVKISATAPAPVGPVSITWRRPLIGPSVWASMYQPSATSYHVKSASECPPGGRVVWYKCKGCGGRCHPQGLSKLSNIGCPSCGLGDWKDKLKSALKKGKGALQSKLKGEIGKRLNPQAADEGGAVYVGPPPSLEEKPFYKNPLVIAGGIAGVVIIGALLLRKK